LSRVPNILYHGTTFGRYMFGIKREGLRGNLPRTLKCDESHQGWCFFTDSAQEAAEYSLITWFFDKSVPEMNPYSATTKCLVLQIQTNHIRKGQWEVDPEGEEQRKFFEEQGSYERIQEFFSMGTWYKFKGNVPSTAIMVKDMLDISKQHPFVLEALAGFTKVRFMAERGEDQALVEAAARKLIDDGIY